VGAASAKQDATGRAQVAAPIKPLNTALLTAPGFSDPRVEFGTERCYVVRRVEMSSGIAIESPPTAPICVTPVDKFPPAAPKSLAHIASGSTVSLLWEANTEADLGGYLVLRGEAPDDKLSPLTPTPITETSFNDTTVRRGRTYVYEIVAVDRQTPPNQSAPSNRVEETIR
jgi:fibronectin type 3 domain-containing protein